LFRFLEVASASHMVPVNFCSSTALRLSEMAKTSLEMKLTIFLKFVSYSSINLRPLSTSSLDGSTTRRCRRSSRIQKEEEELRFLKVVNFLVFKFHCAKHHFHILQHPLLLRIATSTGELQRTSRERILASSVKFQHSLRFGTWKAP